MKTAAETLSTQITREARRMITRRKTCPACGLAIREIPAHEHAENCFYLRDAALDRLDAKSRKSAGK